MKGIGIKNYRSFDNEGILLENLSKLNIIIGKNNSGKSNILRFLQAIHLNINDLSKFPNDIKNQHRRNGENTLFIIELRGKDLPLYKEKINYNLRFNYSDFENNKLIIEFDIINGNVKLPDFFMELDEMHLYPFQNTYSRADRNSLIEVIKRSWNVVIENLIKAKFKDLIYIPHYRVIKEGHNLGDSNATINGSNIISKMFEMKNPKIGEEISRDKFNLIESFVKELTNKEDLKIEIPHTKEEIILTIDGNRLPLESFGTGIHQLVILCSTLVIHDNSIVCIEEPEIHLHPELQRKFINFLEKTNNTYFITTHSNVFLNSKLNTSIYHIKNNGTSAKVEYINKDNQTYDLLDDLGYNSSDILQTNGIIWVEGPSDRIFLNKWINLVNENIIEGLHYSIMFYGGRLLSNVTFDKEKTIIELIPLLKLNRNAFVIMDRDGFKSKVRLNQTKARIIRELGSKNTWVTKGKEIENYLTKKTLTRWLQTPFITMDKDNYIQESINNVSKINYQANKIKYALEISRHIENIDLEMLDLKQKMNQLTEVILKWNQ